MIASINPFFNQTLKVNNSDYRQFNNIQSKVSFRCSNDEDDSFVSQAQKTLNSQAGGVKLNILLILMLLLGAFSGGVYGGSTVKQKLGITDPHDYRMNVNGDNFSTGGINYNSKSREIKIEDKTYKIEETGNTVTVKDTQTGAGATANIDSEGAIDIKIIPNENSLEVNKTKAELPQTKNKVDQIKELID